MPDMRGPVQGTRHRAGAVTILVHERSHPPHVTGLSRWLSIIWNDNARAE